MRLTIYNERINYYIYAGLNKLRSLISSVLYSRFNECIVNNYFKRINCLVMINILKLKTSIPFDKS